MSGLPIVITPSGGMLVTETPSGPALPVKIATDGFGIAVTLVPSGGLPVIGTTGGASSSDVTYFIPAMT